MESAKGAGDTTTQMITVLNVKEEPTHVTVELLLGHWYEGKVLAKPDLNLATVAKALQDKQFKATKVSSELLTLELVGGLIIQLTHCCSKHWVKVGTMKNIEKILKAYPSTHYEYGSTHYHTRNIVERVRIDGWNRGWRIWMPEMRPHGDNPASFFLGTSMWTMGTDDKESQDGNFFHRYVDSNLKPHAGQDRIYDADMYVRKL